MSALSHARQEGVVSNQRLPDIFARNIGIAIQAHLRAGRVPVRKLLASDLIHEGRLCTSLESRLRTFAPGAGSKHRGKLFCIWDLLVQMACSRSRQVLRTEFIRTVMECALAEIFTSEQSKYICKVFRQHAITRTCSVQRPCSLLQPPSCT